MVEQLQPAAADAVDVGAGTSTQNGGSIAFDSVFTEMKEQSLKAAGGGVAGEIRDKLEGALMKAPDVTDEDRKRAKADLADELNELIPDPLRKDVIKAQEAIVDGNTAALADVFKAYAKDPVMLAKIVKELDRDLSRDHAGTHLAMSKDGNILVYGNGSNAALEFSPTDGLKGLRPIQRNADGTATLLDGEIVGADPAKVAKDIGDSTTRGVNRSGLFEIGRIVGGAAAAAGVLASEGKTGAAKGSEENKWQDALKKLKSPF